jgi:malate dehydrogenase
MKRHKIGLVGAGNIGGILGLLSGLEGLGDVVFLDLSEGVACGKSVDLEALAPVMGLSGSWKGGSDASLLEGCDVVIVTAGVPRKPGMSRDDLVEVNAKVVKSIAGNVSRYCPDAFVICITNPLDVMVGLFQRESGLPTSKVVGMAGVLDSARFRAFLAEALGVCAHDVTTFVLGGHGDSMVPVPRYTSVGGIPLSEVVEMGWLKASELESIVDRTRNGGAEVVGLMGTSAYFAPAASGILMAKAYLRDEKRLLPCAAYVEGKYGLEGVYVGVPVLIGAGGVEKVIELELSGEEMKLFESSVGHVRELNGVLEGLALEGKI